MLELLDEHEPGHSGTLERIRERMRGVYPWSRHQHGHEHLGDADAWWRELTPHMAAAIAACGIDPARSRELAGEFRARFLDSRRGWEVYPDVPAALALTRRSGWRNVILSNHVPELPRLVADLGLGEHVDDVHTSGASGWEKPHPRAFALALQACGEPAERWMVGDNPLADGEGAAAAGIPAIIVRDGAASGQATADARLAPDALAAAGIIVGAPA